VEEDQSQPGNDKPQGTRSTHPLDQRIVQVARVVMATKQQVEQLNGAVAQLASQQQHIDDLATDLKQRLGDFHERLGGAGDGEHFAGSAEGGLGAQIQKIEQDLAKALGGIDSTAERVELASSKMDEQVFALKARVTGFAEGVEQWFKPARHEIEANREFVEHASQQVREKIDGFEKTAQALQACVDHGVADLRRRHESRDNDVSALAAKLDDCLGRLEQNPERMSDLALDRLRPLVDALTAHVTQTCLGEQQLGDHLRAMQTNVESAISASEQRVTPILDRLGARLDASETATDEIRETCRALQNQVGGAFGQMEERLASLEKTIDTALGANLDDRLDRLGDHSKGRGAVDEQLTSQLTEIREGLENWGRRSGEDAVHRTELSAEQKLLGAALGRLEEKIEATLDSYRKQSDQNGEQVASVARHLDTISEQLDSRLARSLSEIHAENHQSQQAAAAQRDELAGGQQELGMALLRLQSKVTDSLSAFTKQHSGQGEQSGSLSGELIDLREQLATLGDQLGVMTAEIDNRMHAAVGDTDQVTRQISEKLAEFDSRSRESHDEAATQRTQVAEAQQQLGARLDQMQDMLERSLNDTRSDDGPQLARVERYLTDLREHVVSLGDKIQKGAGQSQDPEQSTDFERQLNELGTDMADLKSLLAAVPTQVDEKVTDAISRSSRTPSREQEQLTGVERQLDDLREHIAALSDRFESAGQQTRTAAPPRDAVTREYLSDVVGQLEQQVTTAISEVAAREPDSDVTHQIEGQLDGLQSQLSTLGERLGSMESSLTELDVATHAVSAPDPVIQEPVDELPAQFETATEQVTPTVTDVPEALPTTPDEISDFVASVEPVVTTDFVTMTPVKDVAEPGESIVFDEVDASDVVTNDVTNDVTDEVTDEVTPDVEPVLPDEPHVPADSGLLTVSVDTAAALPRDELVDTLVSVINSGNADLISSFIKEQYTASALTEGDIETRVEVFMDVHESTGEMRVVTSDEGDDGEIVVILQSRRSLDRQRFVIIRDNNAPHKIVRVNIDSI
jgi:chromosome segregation ATPase